MLQDLIRGAMQVSGFYAPSRILLDRILFIS